jgi:hypothetical protein
MISEKKVYRFKSPGEGAYRVQLLGADPSASTSISFLGGGDIQRVELPTGDYTALIQPLGTSEQTQQALTLDDASVAIALQDQISWGGLAQVKPQTARPSWTARYDAKMATGLETGPDRPKAFNVGISVDDLPGARGGWRAAAPHLAQAMSDGSGLALMIRRPSDWKARPRWRLTIGVEGDGLWRVPLPLFRGGLELMLTPVSTPTGADLALSLTPKDPAKAALVANLHQTFAADPKRLVRAALSSAPSGGGLGGDPVEVLSERLDDPWIAAAAALLIARNGEIRKVEKGVRRLHEAYPWLPDAAVAVAWAYAAGKGDRGDIEAQCLNAIVSARMGGATFFVAADALAADMLTALSIGAVAAEVRAKAKKELGVWNRRSRRRMPTAPFLSWEDPLKTEDDWRLSRRDYALLAEGALRDGAIALETKSAPPSRKPRSGQAPALSRPVQRSDDLNKGRFGGKARRDGFVLSARFARALHDWVRITLQVKGPPGAAANTVEFFLHDSFDPNRIERPLVDGIAEYATLAYGGFTVGAWIADLGLELELDLAEVKGAPLTIATL